MIDLSVIIVNWNTCPLLRRCLLSISTESKGLSLEIMVIDNASTDDSLQMLRTEFPQVTVIANHENVGFARASNQGMAQASGRYCLLLNPDTEILDQALVEIVAYLDTHPTVGAVGPRLILPDGTIQGGAAGFDPSPATLFNYAFMLHALFPNRVRALWLAKKQYEAPEIEVDWVAGACLMIRRSAVNQVGMMDPGYFMYAEDIEWCHRLRTAGWRVICLSQVSVIHYIGGSLRQRDQQFISHNIRGLDSYYRSRYDAVRVFVMHVWGMIGFGLRAALYQAIRLVTRNEKHADTVVTMWQCARSSVYFLRT